MYSNKIFTQGGYVFDDNDIMYYIIENSQRQFKN